MKANATWTVKDEIVTTQNPNSGAIHQAINSQGFCIQRSLGLNKPEELLGYAAVIGSLDLKIDIDLIGPAVMSVQYDRLKTMSADRQAYFSCGAFPLHTDMSFVHNPPRFLMMSCVENDQSGGHSTLSDCRLAWMTLLDEQRRQLEISQFRFRNPPNTPEGDVGMLPIHVDDLKMEMWRFRRDSITMPDASIDAVKRFGDLLDQECFSLCLFPGDLLIVDNHRMTHGRTAFNPDSRRHFLRCYAQDFE